MYYNINFKQWCQMPANFPPQCLYNQFWYIIFFVLLISSRIWNSICMDTWGIIVYCNSKGNSFECEFQIHWLLSFILVYTQILYIFNNKLNYTCFNPQVILLEIVRTYRKIMIFWIGISIFKKNLTGNTVSDLFFCCSCVSLMS